ncbi:MAG: response regulator [Dehalococcoidia bacterium]|nr:MAG: response regulator [Dehalococcoidia bacterium]
MQGKAKILLVDDDPDFVEATKTVLEGKSYQVVTAYNGDDGLKKVIEERPDLIILDVIMPGKDGFAVCKELKTDPRYYFFSKIPVLMLTVYPDDREKARLSLLEGMTMEAEDYIQKPATPEELLRRVEELLKKYG